MKWIIEYDNDTGPSDEGYWEWWTVTDGNRRFKCDSEDDAKWLSDLLNGSSPTQRSAMESDDIRCTDLLGFRRKHAKSPVNQG